MILEEIVIDDLLRRQDVEFRTDFETPNTKLHTIISCTPEEDLLAAGEKLVRSNQASRIILGIRLIREVRQNTETATHILRELLARENDDEVIYWIVSAFGFLKSDSVIQFLKAAAVHPNAGIRYHVATAVSNRSAVNLPDDSFDTLLLLSRDENAEVRFSAIFELGSWWRANQDDRIKPVLQRAAASDTDPAVASAARNAIEDTT